MLRGFVRGVADRVRAFVTRRDPRFPAAERTFIKANPVCVFCGSKAKTAHHAYPVHAYPELEMREEFWAPTCTPCHRPYGHAGNWSMWVERLAMLRAASWLRAGRKVEALRLIASNTLGPKRPAGVV